MQYPQPYSQTQKIIECPNCHKPLPNFNIKTCHSCQKQLAYCDKYQTLVVAESSKCDRCNMPFIECSNPKCQRKLHESMEKCYFCQTPVAQVTNSTNGHALPQTPSNLVITEFEPSHAANNGNGSSSSQVASPEEKNGTSQESLITIESTLLDLKKKIETGEAEIYFPGDQHDRARILRSWKKEINRTLSFIDVVRQSRIDQLNEYEIRDCLTRVAHQLDFTRRYEIKAIGHTGAGKSTLLAAILAEDESVFPRGHGDSVTAVRTRVRLCSKEEQETMKQEMMYVYFLDQQRPVEKYPRDQWAQMAEIYIEKPIKKNSDDKNDNQVDEVDYVEFVLNAKTHPVLPPGSYLIDLPGGASGYSGDDAILKKELEQVDAMILFAGGSRLNSDLVTPTFARVAKMVRDWTPQPTIAVKKIFLIATYWDKATSGKDGKDLLRSINAMNKLINGLSDGLGINYSNNNPRGKDKDPFYPVRGQDAFFAQLYIRRIKSGEYDKMTGEELEEAYKNLNEEHRLYLSGLVALYKELKRFNPDLLPLKNPADAIRSIEYHEAMLDFSGLSEFMKDLKKFLMENRFDVQIEEARSGIEKALGILHTVAWSKVNLHLSLSSNDLKELEEAFQEYKQEKPERYKKELESRVNAMRTAWSNAREQFSNGILKQRGNDASMFHQKLSAAHEQAKERVKSLIDGGYQRFDDTIITSVQILRMPGGIPTDDLPSDIVLPPFLSTLRESYRVSIEKELKEPVKVLYDTLLLPFEEEERSGGRLNIYEITFGEFDTNSPFQSRYREIKRTIQRIAHEACFYITMGVLFGNGSALKGNSSSVLGLKEYIVNNSMKPDEELVKEAHPLMKDVLDAMLAKIVEITESTILFYFRYELDKLLEYYAYDGIPVGSNFAKTEELPREGEFLKLLDDLKHELRKRVEDPKAERLRARLDELLYKDESQIEHWVNVIREIERVRKGEIEEEHLPVLEATIA